MDSRVVKSLKTGYVFAASMGLALLLVLLFGVATNLIGVKATLIITAAMIYTYTVLSLAGWRPFHRALEAFDHLYQ
ncbi:MAG: hypothetical protein WC243_04650 [Patescibacteria group bacterium]|jgi:hypothetical protein